MLMCMMGLYIYLHSKHARSLKFSFFFFGQAQLSKYNLKAQRVEGYDGAAMSSGEIQRLLNSGVISGVYVSVYLCICLSMYLSMFGGWVGLGWGVWDLHIDMHTPAERTTRWSWTSRSLIYVARPHTCPYMCPYMCPDMCPCMYPTHASGARRAGHGRHTVRSGLRTCPS